MVRLLDLKSCLGLELKRVLREGPGIPRTIPRIETWYVNPNMLVPTTPDIFACMQVVHKEQVRSNRRAPVPGLPLFLDFCRGVYANQTGRSADTRSRGLGIVNSPSACSVAFRS